MKLTTKYMKRNDCYKAGRKITPKGIMIHSTATPGVMAAAWFNRWNKSYQKEEISRQVCVHAFVDDQEAWQYLPWNHRGWHAGGSANNTHIGIEICEPAGFTYTNGASMSGYNAAKQEAYFRAIWKNTVALCVMLCETYQLTEKNILCHSEGFRKGIASNHADVMHWFVKHGENMDTFRTAVKSTLMKKSKPRPQEAAQSIISDGDIVEITNSATTYYPAGPNIPNWVKKNSYHKVTQTASNGKPVMKGGKKCVLLGKKVDRKSNKETAGIMTWIDQQHLIIIRPQAPTDNTQRDKPTESLEKITMYRVQVGAYANKGNAETTLQKLKTAGFAGYIVSN